MQVSAACYIHTTGKGTFPKIFSIHFWSKVKKNFTGILLTLGFSDNGVYTKRFGIVDQTVYLYIRITESQYAIFDKNVESKVTTSLKIEIAKYFALEINYSPKE